VKTMREVLHLDFEPTSVAWIGQLQTRLANSSSPELRKRYVGWASVGLGELALAIATRIAIANRVEERLQECLAQLSHEVGQSGELDSLLGGNCAFHPRDEQLLFDICAGVDACFFQWRSLYEVLGKFATAFAKEILDTKISESQLVSVVQGAGVPVDWVSTVRENRKLFFHQTAPWIALEILTREPLRCGLVIMKENLSSFDDDEKFITEAELIEVSNGLRQAVIAVRGWLEAQVVALEEKLNASAG
jgi:hypothetical protein